MEENDTIKQKWDDVVGAAAIGGAGLPLLWLITLAVPDFLKLKTGLIADFAFVLAMYLGLPVSAFGLFGVLVLGLIGAAIVAIGAYYWQFVFKR